MKERAIVFLLLLTIVLVGCSSEPKPPTCEVYVSGNNINVVIDLPEEGTEYRNMHQITPTGFTGSPSRLTVESGGSEVNYSKTGNTYNIKYNITYEKGEITGYQISIKGNVYGDVEHTCVK